MRTLVAVLLVLFAAGLVNAGQPLSPKELVRQRGIQKNQDRQERRRAEAAWAAFTSQFYVRLTVPVYSGPYQTGVNVVMALDVQALERYRMQLDEVAWNSMTDQQKRDVALFTIARNTGIIAANTGMIANKAGRIADKAGRIADQLERDARTQEMNRILGR